ncbi:uncharacterized protein PHACADRAFT_197324 [Phanerochaete carnosa HHB-10118-sp]|uniref:Uncharacterized protein n=1 Tax=Phanerochaete carnosa (strain HHB-10118-sp) TaxID=650164 RepID=K5UXS5_PHACS|nr:uncharacterized protein PHACADRAFT_197324 [Phanerochaete carnosa HHB-10118-sp]EKM54891.1 hypothetical protein PHACADRAFT_197324 [Phanerochaete carnosa HHB-10118-sp]
MLEFDVEGDRGKNKDNSKLNADVDAFNEDEIVTIIAEVQREHTLSSQEQQFARFMVTKIVKFAKRIFHSPTIHTDLKSCCVKEKIPDIQIVQAIATHWNLLAQAISCALKLCAVVVQLLDMPKYNKKGKKGKKGLAHFKLARDAVMAVANCFFQALPLSQRQVNSVLIYSLQGLISQMLHSTILDLPTKHPVAELLHRRADEILCALNLVTFHWDSPGIGQNPHKREFDVSFPTLRTQLFLMLVATWYPMRRTSQCTLELEQISPDISSSPRKWLAFATQCSGVDLDFAEMSEEDVSIFARAVNQALREMYHHSPQDVEKLCQIMISALEQVTSVHCRAALCILHETWTKQLIQDKALGDDSDQIVLAMLERSSSSLLRLLQALQVDGCDTDGKLAGYLVDVLLVAHRIPTEPAGPDTALEPFGALRRSTMLLKGWPSDVGEYAQEWHRQFVWTGGHWIREIGRKLSPSASQDTVNFSRDCSDVLRKMIGAMQLAEQNGWRNRDQDDAIIPWLEDLFSTVLEDTNHKPHGDESHATADVLFRYAPDAFGSFIDALERVAKAHQFRSPLLDKLYLMRRQIVASAPEETVAQG